MKVLVAVDGSQQSNDALDFYFSNIHKQGDEVVVFSHARLPCLSNSVLAGVSLKIQSDIEQTVNEHREKCKSLERALTARCQSFWPANFTVVVETQDGGVGPNIIAKAEEIEAALLVTGSRGLGKIRRSIVGSVSNYVIHHAKIPVLVYYETQPDKV